MTPSSELYVKAFGEDGLENTKYPQIPAIAPERSNDKTIFWSWLIPAYLAAYLFDPHNFISNPTWTVLTKEDVYMNVGTTFEEDFISFNKKVVELNSKTKQLDPSSDLDISSLCNEPNVFYASCLPILDVISFRHPTPSGDHDNLSIPRILWGKFILKEDNRYHLTLNITTSHCLVDGFPLAKVFINLREIISSFRI